MTERDFKILFSATYQLSQAMSYLAGMINEDSQIKLQYVKEQSNVLNVPTEVGLLAAAHILQQ